MPEEYCQENAIKGTIGTNFCPPGGCWMGERLLEPTDAYQHAVMRVFVR